MKASEGSILLIEPCHPAVPERDPQVEFMQFLMNELGAYGERVDGVGVFTKPVNQEGLQFTSIASRKLTPLIFTITLAVRLLLLPLRKPKVAHVAAPLYVLPLAVLIPTLPVIVTLFSDRGKRSSDYGMLIFLQRRIEAFAFKKAAKILVANHAIGLELPQDLHNKVFIMDCNVAQYAHFSHDASTELQNQFGTDKSYFVLASDFSDDSADFAIDIWARFFQQSPQQLLIIIGDGPRRQEVEEKITGTCHWNRPRFIGSVTPDLHARYLRSASGYIVSAHGQSAELRLREALSCALPVIIADTNPLAKLVTQGETGYIIPNEAEVYVQAIDAISRGMISSSSVMQYHQDSGNHIRRGAILVNRVKSVYMQV